VPAKQQNGANRIAFTVTLEDRNFLMGLGLHKKKKVISEAIKIASSLSSSEKRRTEPTGMFNTSVDDETFIAFGNIPKGSRSVLIGMAIKQITERI